MYPPFQLAKLSPSPLRGSGLRTVARKVRKQNIRNHKIDIPEGDTLLGLLFEPSENERSEFE
jgi:hypothetical protein